eukprot:7181492-Prymnesium_polylepis.1
MSNSKLLDSGTSRLAEPPSLPKPPEMTRVATAGVHDGNVAARWPHRGPGPAPAAARTSDQRTPSKCHRSERRLLLPRCVAPRPPKSSTYASPLLPWYWAVAWCDRGLRASGTRIFAHRCSTWLNAQQSPSGLPAASSPCARGRRGSETRRGLNVRAAPGWSARTA